MALLGFFFGFFKKLVFFWISNIFFRFIPTYSSPGSLDPMLKKLQSLFYFLSICAATFFASDATFFSKTLCVIQERNKEFALFSILKGFFTQQKRIFRFHFRISNERIFSWLERFCEKNDKKINQIRGPEKEGKFRLEICYITWEKKGENVRKKWINYKLHTIQKIDGKMSKYLLPPLTRESPRDKK